MQITSAVPKYNFYLPAYGAGRLAADLGTQINALYSDNPPREENPTKAKYLTALLVGPVYEAFNGIPNQRDAGAAQDAPPHLQRTMYRRFSTWWSPSRRAPVDLLGSPSKQYKDRKKTLSAEVAALRLS